MTVAIRKAEPRDLPTVGRLGAMLVRTHYEFDKQRFLAPVDGIENGYAAFLGRAVKSPDSCVFVADDDGEVVGYTYAALEPMSWQELRGPAGFVHDVAVAENSRRKGVATLLMNAAMQWLREHGAPRVIIWTAAPNQAAHALFHRLGFRDTMIEMTREL